MRWILRLFWVITIFSVGAVIGDRWGVPMWAKDAGALVWGEGQRIFDRGAPLATEALQEAQAYAEEKLANAPPEDLDENDLVTAANEGREKNNGALPNTDQTDEQAWAAGDVLPLCPKMTVSNAPQTNAGIVTTPMTYERGTTVLDLRVAPGSCLSSGFGTRNAKLHKGIDFFHPSGVPIFTAAAGTIVEAGYRPDYGNYVAIAHSDDLVTVYAHLKSIAGSIRKGSPVTMGQNLGTMGNSAAYKIPTHLHFEIRVGNYDSASGFSGMMPVNPFGS